MRTIHKVSPVHTASLRLGEKIIVFTVNASVDDVYVDSTSSFASGVGEGVVVVWVV
jgi:hypothetical protein